MLLKRCTATALFLAVTVLPASAQSRGPSAALIGTWLLESLVDTLPDGSLYHWMGNNPSGTITYDQHARMAVQLRRDPPARFASTVADEATPEERRAAYDGYYAYYGRYELSAAGDSVVHHVEGSLRPGEVGIVYRRAVIISGDRLVIHLRPTEADGLVHHRVLTWRRAR